MERVVIYSRVSTTDQTCENQIKLLQSIVDQNGWELIDTYIDQGISGSKGRDKRPEFDRLCKDMVRRRFDKVMVWDVSRLGRSLQHLVEFLNDVQSLNCHLYIHQSGLLRISQLSATKSLDKSSPYKRSPDCRLMA